MPAEMKITGEHVSDWDRINTPAFYVISRVSGEGADRKARKGDYYLTDTEKSELEAICGIYNKVVVILNVGGVIDLKFTDELNIRGILLMSLAGMEGGNALADIVSGRFSPSGKLSDTWAMDYQDYPSSKNFSHNNGNTAREFYTDGIYVGYRYFDTFNVLPRYAFGYGMSYTSFSVRYPEDAVLEGTTVSLKAEVVNTGRAVGRETVMLFVSCPWGLRKKELKRLTDFKKTRPLYPSKSQKLTLSFDLEQLLSYHTGRASWYLDAGDYLLLAGTSSDNVTVAGRLRLNNTVWMAEGTNICPLHDALKEIEPEEDRFKNIRIVKDDKAIDINEAASELENTWADRKKHLSEEKPGLEEINERFASLAFAEDTDTNQLSFIEEADHPADGGESDNSKDIKRLISILSLKEKAAIVCGQPGGRQRACLRPGGSQQTRKEAAEAGSCSGCEELLFHDDR